MTNSELLTLINMVTQLIHFNEQLKVITQECKVAEDVQDLSRVIDFFRFSQDKLLNLVANNNK